MKKQVLLDTGPLVALVNARDTHHDWALLRWAEIRPPLLTCESVISEACFLLDRARGRGTVVFEMLRRGAIVIGFRLDEHLDEVQRLREKYASIPMSLADASLVRMAEQLGQSEILTLDQDFRVYRKHGRHVIPLILPAAPRS